VSDRTIDAVYARLEVTNACEIDLHEAPRLVLGRRLYVARARERRTYVERRIATYLRAGGAVWCGDVRRDPCAVA
jgi:hypothetical protein